MHNSAMASSDAKRQAELVFQQRSVAEIREVTWTCWWLACVLASSISRQGGHVQCYSCR